MSNLELVRTALGNYKCPADPGEECYGTGAGRISVTDEEADILATLALDADVLEVGTGLGVSTRAMARTAKSLVTIDTDPWVQGAVELPESVVRRTDWPDATFDMIFIDGAHDHDSVQEDVRRALDRLRRPGRLVIHDCNMAPVWYAAVDVIRMPPAMRYETACSMCEWGIL